MVRVETYISGERSNPLVSRSKLVLLSCTIWRTSRRIVRIEFQKLLQVCVGDAGERAFDVIR